MHGYSLNRIVRALLFSQMVANAKAAGDEIAVLQTRLMDTEFEKGNS